VKELLPLTPEQLARAEELLRNPPPGSSIEAARDFGIDLMQLMEQLRLTPDERVRKLEAATRDLAGVRGIALKPRRGI
jgi:hypothetical protein